jgi:hypothetical protein
MIKTGQKLKHIMTVYTPCVEIFTTVKNSITIFLKLCPHFRSNFWSQDSLAQAGLKQLALPHGSVSPEPTCVIRRTPTDDFTGIQEKSGGRWWDNQHSRL